MARILECTRRLMWVHLLWQLKTGANGESMCFSVTRPLVKVKEASSDGKVQVRTHSGNDH